MRISELFATICVVMASIILVTSGTAVAATAVPVQSSYVLELDTFATHSGSRAIDVASPDDGSGRVFATTQSGGIYAYDSAGSSLGVFLDLSTTTATTSFIDGNGAGSFRGLMYFDFHPDFANPNTPGYRKVYTGFQVDPNSGTADYARTNGSPQQYVIGEWEVDASNPNQIDTSTYREVFRIETKEPDPHGLGNIKFNPLAKPGDDDYGLLYAAIGDANAGGNGNPGAGYLQDLGNPFGKILRINPLQNGSDPYSVPTSNPFNNGGTLLDNDGVAEEIYAIGFRDQQTFSFAKDAAGETVLVTFDIGAAQREEVDIVRLGGNYGWDRWEGTNDLNPTRPLAPGTTHSPPVLEYDHSVGFAIIGGFVVSDPNDPSFQNRVIFSDLVNGKMFHADYAEMLAAELTGTQATIYEMMVEFEGDTGNFADVLDHVDGGRGDARFGIDESGNLFIVSKQTGTIFNTGLVATFVPEPSVLLIMGVMACECLVRRR